MNYSILLVLISLGSTLVASESCSTFGVSKCSSDKKQVLVCDGQNFILAVDCGSNECKQSELNPNMVVCS